MRNRGIGEGLTRTYGLWLDGAPIAGGFGLAHRGAFLLVLTGSDLAVYKNLCLGLLAMEDILRDCMGRGDAVFDLTIGDEAYKRQFGTKLDEALGHLGEGQSARFSRRPDDRATLGEEDRQAAHPKAEPEACRLDSTALRQNR